MVHAAPKTTEAAATEAAQAAFTAPSRLAHTPTRGYACEAWAWRTLRRKLAGKTRGLTGQKLSPRSVRVGGDDRVRTHCVSLLVPSEEAADCNHQHDAGEANRKLHRNVVADGGQQDLAEHREQDPEAEHL